MCETSDADGGIESRKMVKGTARMQVDSCVTALYGHLALYEWEQRHRGLYKGYPAWPEPPEPQGACDSNHLRAQIEA